jgi:hypothetical protein
MSGEHAGDTGTGHRVWRAQTTQEAGLRGLADVAVVQAADFGKLDNLPWRGELDRPEVRRVLAQREVGTRPMVRGGVRA